jgi:hypothetical protein
VSPEKSWHTIFDVKPESRKSYAKELASFEQHKTALLDILRKAHGNGPKLKPFDEQPAWRALIRAAAWYFRRPILKQKTLLPARRVERLQDLAKALSPGSRYRPQGYARRRWYRSIQGMVDRVGTQYNSGVGSDEFG